jgi:AraC-like DNA-binding protein
MNLTQWAEYLNITPQTMSYRLRHGGESNPKLFDPGFRKIAHPITGETLSPAEWARRLDLSHSSFMNRIQKLGEKNPMVWNARKKVRAFPKK